MVLAGALFSKQLSLQIAKCRFNIEHLLHPRSDPAQNAGFSQLLELEKGLHQYKEAVALYQQRIDPLQAVSGKQPVPYGLACIDLGDLYLAAGDRSFARQWHKKAVDCLSGHIKKLIADGRREEALALRDRLFAAVNATLDAANDPVILYWMANVSYDIDDHAAAIDYCQKAIEAGNRLNKHGDLDWPYWLLGTEYARSGKAAEAVACFQNYLALRRKVLPVSHTYIGLALNGLMGAASSAQDWPLAQRAAKQAIAVWQDNEGNDARQYEMAARIALYNAEDKLGAQANRDAVLKEIIARLDDMPNNMVKFGALQKLGITLSGLGKAPVAERYLLQALQLLDKLRRNDTVDAATCHFWSGVCHEQMGQPAVAFAEFDTAARLCEKLSRADYHLLSASASAAGREALRLGNRIVAFQWFCVALLNDKHDYEVPWIDLILAMQGLLDWTKSANDMQMVIPVIDGVLARQDIARLKEPSTSGFLKNYASLLKQYGRQEKARAVDEALKRYRD